MVSWFLTTSQIPLKDFACSLTLSESQTKALGCGTSALVYGCPYQVTDHALNQGMAPPTETAWLVCFSIGFSRMVANTTEFLSVYPVAMTHANISEIMISLCTMGPITIPVLSLTLSFSHFLSFSILFISPPVTKIDVSFPSLASIQRPMKRWTCLRFKWTPSLSQPFSLVCVFVACLCEPLAAKKASKSVGVSGARPWRITNVWNPIQRLNSGGPELAGGSWGSFTLVKDSNSLRLLGSTNNLTEAKDLWAFQREL